MKPISLMCPISTSTGYGITSFNIFKGLQSAGYDPLLYAIGNSTTDSEENKALLVKSMNRAKTEFNQHSPCLKIWHQFDLAGRIGSGKFGALVFFETNKMNPVEIVMLNNTDVVFVASHWAKKVLEENGINSDIVVSPLAVDHNIFSPIKSIDLNDTAEKDQEYIFMNIGKWEVRKGHDVLVEAFNAAFEPTDNVRLRMMNHNPFLTTEQNAVWAKMYKNSKLGDKIDIVDRVSSHAEVASLINASDCGVFPARAEGWNNEIPEFMACNKPIITTNYSAHTEYCNSENSYLIEIDNLCEAKDDHFFRAGLGQWADLGEKQVDQLVEHMRFVYKNNVRDNQSGVKTAKTLTWANTAKILGDSLYADSIQET